MTLAQAVKRFEAAEALARASATLVLLERCERATGTRWVSDGDREWVKACSNRWARYR